MRRISRRSATRDAPVYEARTHDIVVRVVANYAEDESDPEEQKFLWAYTVEIENHGRKTVTLLRRHWIITDAMNRVQEVEGEGVVGEQPRLKASEAFRYTSFCPLGTPSGAMRGSYQMINEDGDRFDVTIPEFSLHLPGAGRVVN